MGASNQEMVNNVHLNLRGFKGDGITYFFKPQLRQERYGEISAVVVSDRSGKMRSESNVLALPSVKETVGVIIFHIIYQLLKISLRSHDYFNANSLNKWQPLAKQTYNSARAYPLPLPHAVCCCIPPQKYFPKFHERLTHVR